MARGAGLGGFALCALVACSGDYPSRDLGALPANEDTADAARGDVPLDAVLPSVDEPASGQATIRGAGVVILRAEPKLAGAPVGETKAGAPVDLVCQTQGEAVDGNNVWSYVKAANKGGYVASRDVDTGHSGFVPGVPRCKAASTSDAGKPPATSPTTTAPPATPAPGYYLPLACNTSASVVQGPGGSYSHNTAQSKDAYDFGLSNDTPLVAAEAGTVKMVRGDVRPGNPCYSGGGSSCANTVNYVLVAHADGTDTLYLHVNTPLVTVGQAVKRGERIALSGGTGWSTGPHAHVQRQSRCGIWICNSLPLTFVEAGVPGTGKTVVSRNCP